MTSGSRTKKVSVPVNAISRVIGRSGCNINAIREASGAHIEIEKQKGQGDRTVTIRGGMEATKQAAQLIQALVNEPDKEMSELLNKSKSLPPGAINIPACSATTTGTTATSVSY